MLLPLLKEERTELTRAARRLKVPRTTLVREAALKDARAVNAPTGTDGPLPDRREPVARERRSTVRRAA